MGRSMGKLMQGLITHVALVIGVIIGLSLLPLIAIWSINTLFLTTIPYTIETFLAIYGLFCLIQLKVKNVPTK